jgi:hypothetical protein
MAKDGEIVGLKGTSNGRSCVCHDCCGACVNLNYLIRFRLSVADVDGKIEEAIQVIRIRDGSESCTIGFLPRNIVKSGKENSIGKFAQIIELYFELHVSLFFEQCALCLAIYKLLCAKLAFQFQCRLQLLKFEAKHSNCDHKIHVIHHTCLHPFEVDHFAPSSSS